MKEFKITAGFLHDNKYYIFSDTSIFSYPVNSRQHSQMKKVNDLFTSIPQDTPINGAIMIEKDKGILFGKEKMYHFHFENGIPTIDQETPTRSKFNRNVVPYISGGFYWDSKYYIFTRKKVLIYDQTFTKQIDERDLFSYLGLYDIFHVNCVISVNDTLMVIYDNKYYALFDLEKAKAIKIKLSLEDKWVIPPITSYDTDDSEQYYDHDDIDSDVEYLTFATDNKGYFQKLGGGMLIFLFISILILLLLQSLYNIYEGNFKIEKKETKDLFTI